MACFSGPEILNDGLVFCYDQGNIQKSWKGAPAVNLATSQTLVNHSLVTLPTFSDAPEKGPGWKKAIVTATSSNFRMLKMPVFNVAADSTTTYSIEFECNSPEVYLNIDGTGFGGGTWTKIGPTRYSRTVATAVAGSAYLFINSNNVNASVNYIIYYKEYQIEANTFATPFVDGTRSNAQALLDMTGQNTVTANLLTYASNNTFSFNGSNNDIIISGPVSSFFTDFSQQITLSAWIRIPVAATWTNGFLGNILSRSSYAGSVGLWRNTVNNQIIAYFRQAGTTFGAVQCIGTIERDVWVNIVASWTGSSLSLYLNGVLSQTNTGTLGGANIANWTIGNVTAAGGNVGNRFQGEAGITQIYNRALTATEVKQNFEATRGRFGI